jgi:hypothetical protein
MPYKDKNKKLEYDKDYRQSHKFEHAEYIKQYAPKHREQLLMSSKKFRQAHKDKIINYRQDHKAEMKEYKKKYYQIPENKLNHLEYDRRYYHTHRAEREEYLQNNKAYIAEYKLKKKMDALTHYGNGKCACVRCGFDDIRALSIDHKNGDGYIHRKEIAGGTSIYRWLKRNNYPEGYQTLCMNCQFIKRVEKHEYSRKSKKMDCVVYA